MSNRKPFWKLTPNERVERMLDNEPKTLFEILNLLPSHEDDLEVSEELHKKLHSAKFVACSPVTEEVSEHKK